MVILIAVLDIVQTLYLKWLAKNLKERRTFLLNELFFCAAGTIAAVIFIYANSEPQPNAKYSCAASVAIAR